MKDSAAVHDKMEILNCFNKHFICSGSPFESCCPGSGVEVYTGQPFKLSRFPVGSSQSP